MLDDQYDLIGDDAVFRRTIAGQHELVAPSGRLDALQSWLLAAVTGHTSLQVLADLCGADSEVRTAIVALHAQGLVAFVEPEPLWAGPLVGSHQPPASARAL